MCGGVAEQKTRWERFSLYLTGAILGLVDLCVPANLLTREASDYYDITENERYVALATPTPKPPPLQQPPAAAAAGGLVPKVTFIGALKAEKEIVGVPAPSPVGGAAAVGMRLLLLLFLLLLLSFRCGVRCLL